MLLKARGKSSITLTLVVTTWAMLCVKFLIGGLTIGAFGEAPVIGAGEFGLAVTGILGIWIGREWKEKDIEQRKDG